VHIVVSIVAAFLIIGVILGLLSIKPIKGAIEVVGGLVLVIGAGLLGLTSIAGVFYLVYLAHLLVMGGA